LLVAIRMQGIILIDLSVAKNRGSRFTHRVCSKTSVSAAGAPVE
jgi:hypothetical protein